jgi:hypothetical protein
MAGRGLPVIKQSKIRRKTVNLHPVARPSRIRRDPALADKPQNFSRNAWWTSQEWEVRLAIVGITFFALAISAAVIDLGTLFGH